MHFPKEQHIYYKIYVHFFYLKDMECYKGGIEANLSTFSIAEDLCTIIIFLNGGLTILFFKIYIALASWPVESPLTLSSPSSSELEYLCVREF